LAHRPPYKPIAIKKGLMFVVNVHLIQKQGLVSLVTMRMIATLVTPGLVLVQEEITTISTLVVTRPHPGEIMETSTSKPWDTFLCSKTDRM